MRFDPFDPAFARSMVRDVFEPTVEGWFRPRLIGAERIPKKGPLILIGNHSGNAFPYDGMVLDAALWRRDGMRPEMKCRTLFEKELALTWWMRPFGLDDFWRKCGGVDVTFDNFERMLRRGDRLIFYPEGVPGIGKGFSRRYQLQRFHGSFATLACRHDVPVIPISIVNAEWIVPFSFTLRPVDWVMQRLFHVPFLPLPAGPVAIVFPWAWWLAMPARMTFVVGEPLDVRDLARQEGIADPSNPDRTDGTRVAERVRKEMQVSLDRHVRRYGRRPYHARSLLRSLQASQQKGRMVNTLPTGWTANFVRFDRDRRREPARGRLHAWLRDWDLLAYYLPLGWPLLSLVRAGRRPPYGYRGLGRDERRKQEGGYFWRLSERPLPPREE